MYFSPLREKESERESRVIISAEHLRVTDRESCAITFVSFEDEEAACGGRRKKGTEGSFTLRERNYIAFGPRDIIFQKIYALLFVDENMTPFPPLNHITYVNTTYTLREPRD